MLFQSKIQKALLLLLVIAVIGSFYIYVAQRSQVKEEVTHKLTSPGKQDKEVAKIELKTETTKVLDKLDVIQKITLRQGNLQINGQLAVHEYKGAPVEDRIKEPPPMLPSNNNDYVGVSITNTSGKIISRSGDQNEFETEQNQMIEVENMGQPQGVDFRPQPVYAKTKEDLESKELKILEEKRLRRKSNFVKSLEQREARKALFKTRN